MNKEVSLEGEAQPASIIYKLLPLGLKKFIDPKNPGIVSESHGSPLGSNQLIALLMAGYSTIKMKSGLILHFHYEFDPTKPFQSILYLFKPSNLLMYRGALVNISRTRGILPSESNDEVYSISFSDLAYITNRKNNTAEHCSANLWTRSIITSERLGISEDINAQNYLPEFYNPQIMDMDRVRGSLMGIFRQIRYAMALKILNLAES